MEKVVLSNQNSDPTFIGSWMINPLSICDELITYFESNKNRQKKGVSGAGENADVKNSIDITISPNEIKLPGNEVLMNISVIYFLATKIMSFSGLF